jgi:hypothetical protein
MRSLNRDLGVSVFSVTSPELGNRGADEIGSSIELRNSLEFSSCTYTINIETAWMETPPFPDRSSYGELVGLLSQQLLSGERE